LGHNKSQFKFILRTKTTLTHVPTLLCFGLVVKRSKDLLLFYLLRFGHEDAVLGIDSLIRDRAVSCGGRDRTVRLWKIAEESQLVFHSSNM